MTETLPDSSGSWLACHGGLMLSEHINPSAKWPQSLCFLVSIVKCDLFVCFFPGWHLLCLDIVHMQMWISPSTKFLLQTFNMWWAWRLRDQIDKNHVYNENKWVLRVSLRDSLKNEVYKSNTVILEQLFDAAYSISYEIQLWYKFHKDNVRLHF